MSQPSPIDMTTVIQDDECWWYTDDGPCLQPATGTRYDSVRSAWVPVCEQHRPNRR